jgi:hypothetical protein
MMMKNVTCRKASLTQREADRRRAWLETLEPKMVAILDGAVQGGQRVGEANLDVDIEAARVAYHNLRAQAAAPRRQTSSSRRPPSTKSTQ